MRVPSGRPWVVVNMAISADGKIATANRRLETFGSARDHEELLRLRSHMDAVLCGARTAGGAGITLNSGGAAWVRRRRARGLADEPMRVVVSGRGGLPTSAGMFRSAGGPRVVVVSGRAPARRKAGLRKVCDELLEMGRDSVDLAALLGWLHRERGVRRLVCEGGADLNDAMFRAGLVDEVRVTVCPVVVGGRRAPTLVEGLGWPALAQATRLEWVGQRRVGDELFLTLRTVRDGAARRKLRRP